MKFSKFFNYTASLILLLLVFSAFWLRQDISDWIRLRGYNPPSKIVALTEQTTMLASSRRLFYVQHPELADKADFNEQCRSNEQTIVLGCFISGRGIYLLEVDDQRLEGIEQVTAAHELLHAAYERLNGDERSRINKLLQSAFDRLNSDRIKDTIELYRKQDPTIVSNELHSILGTEVANLPDELEDYFKRYFSNRSKIVAFSEQYEQVFIERQNLIKDYDADLARLKPQISKLELSLKQRDSELRNQRSNMNNLRQNGQINAYNAQVADYNAKVRDYNGDIDYLRSLIARYNDIVQKRNAVAAETAELVEAIDSRDIVPEQH